MYKRFEQKKLQNQSQQYFLEDNILDIFVLAVLGLDSKLQCLWLANSRASNIELAMGENIGTEPNSNMFQCLTLNSVVKIRIFTLGLLTL